MDNKEAARRIREHMIVHMLREERAIFITEALDKAIASLEAWDKIRTEIETLEYLYIEDGSDGYDKYVEQYEVLKIIDKYKEESESD